MRFENGQIPVKSGQQGHFWVKVECVIVNFGTL